ncbi:glycosyltransferase family 2 protein [Argonema galeatum]|uniref:glycosyltransferase family 2 protein n=1 Tax=Argonema galeatum TaxID=2942762 RepID=UPI0020132881|nr:glycosyltransferase family 2 protein [Argonema galeatum]MCL1467692.1 glycosyltransferase family 2 protein [Argonema galeatum A003/A1]
MKTPVAFLVFNRPDTTEKVFERIREAKPPKLLVVADGPRADKEGEAEKCALVRAVIDRVDWDCEVFKNYSNTNMGCKRRISSGLDWVFNTVEEAIILEDDCLPHPTFFRFCEELLEYYRHDTRVTHIGGNNFGISGSNNNESYYFSRLTHIWGWASWRRAWQYYDVNISFWQELKKGNGVVQMLSCQKEYEVRSKIWDKVYAGEIDTWDYQWVLSSLCQGGYAILPNKNLISNIGFGQASTHTSDANNPFANMKTYELEFPLVHPKFFLIDREADQMYFKIKYEKGLVERAINKVNKVLGKLQVSSQ